MYEIKRSARIKDELKLTDGDKVVIVSVDIDIDGTMNRYIQAQNHIARIKRKYSGTVEETVEMGKATIGLLEVFFGSEGTELILNHYEGHVLEMLEDVLPYIGSVLVPKLKAASRDKKDRMIAMHKARRW